MKYQRRIAVAGLGNVSMGDDGVGPYVVSVLKARYSFPPDVEVLDLGTPGLDLIPRIAGLEALILVDTVRGDGAPGSVRFYDQPAQLAMRRQPRMSPQDPALAAALAFLEIAGEAPKEAILVGVVPQCCALGPGLTEACQGSIDRAVREIVNLLLGYGAVVEVKDIAHPANLWWETPIC